MAGLLWQAGHVSSGCTSAPFEIPIRETEPFPDTCRQFQFRDLSKTKRLIKADQVKLRVHIQGLVPAGIHQVPYRHPGISPPAVHLRCIYRIDLKAVRVPAAPGCSNKGVLGKHAEYPVKGRVGFLLMVPEPDALLPEEIPVYPVLLPARSG